nr:hypothetical protein Iba_chr02eCG12170 [Ipomoea batatas]GMC68461.1 hypothetical protein Iba_chr02fCG12100 [Ipomoea batatas]GME06286.1 hypothetical protein Iba_scaffold3983CG0270 [Ipomoea batatas]
MEVESLKERWRSKLLGARVERRGDAFSTQVMNERSELAGMGCMQIQGRRGRKKASMNGRVVQGGSGRKRAFTHGCNALKVEEEDAAYGSGLIIIVY